MNRLLVAAITIVLGTGTTWAGDLGSPKQTSESDSPAAGGDETGGAQEPSDSTNAEPAEVELAGRGPARWLLHDWYGFLGVGYFVRNSVLETSGARNARMPYVQHGFELHGGYSDFWEIGAALRVATRQTEQTILRAQNDSDGPRTAVSLGFYGGLLTVGRSSFLHRVAVEPSFGLWNEVALARPGPGEQARGSTLPVWTLGPYIAVGATACRVRTRLSIVPVSFGVGNHQARDEYASGRQTSLGLQGDSADIVSRNLRFASFAYHATIDVDVVLGRQQTCDILGRRRPSAGRLDPDDGSHQASQQPSRKPPSCSRPSLP